MKTSYHERDYAYGSAMLTLRNTLGLTQEGLAHFLGISRRAVGDWEAGCNYPKATHLKQVIALGVQQQAFSPGHEAQEIQTLWKIARQKVLLDESWLSALLEQPRSPQPYVASPAFEEIRNYAPVMVNPALGPRVDWDNAPLALIFYGRTEEQAQLTQWIIQQECRVVSVLGMGGIGKSTLAIHSMHELAEHFEVVIFRSLHDAPSCEALLADCLQAFAPQFPGAVPITLEQRLNLLISHLREVRALVVLDNLECLIEDGDVRGHFRPGFEEYASLLRRVAETAHQSCLLLTSREKPADLRAMEGKYSQVRSLRLAGLDTAACQQLIEEKEMVGSQQELAQLIEVYSGNPLALKIVGETIVDLFGGEIGPFLASGPVIFGSISDLLDEQFARLSNLEQTVMYWLAIIREPMTFDELQTLLAHSRLRVQLFEALDSLRQRSLIERGKRPGSFTLQTVVLEYATAALIAQASCEIQQHRLDRLIQHSLCQTTAHEYLRQTQERLILSPLLANLQSVYPRRTELEEHLLSLLDKLRTWNDCAQGYGPTNLMALLRLQRGHLSGLDLLDLSLREAYL
jgi:DNA-binding XRE family transcriptional regulator